MQKENKEHIKTVKKFCKKFSDVMFLDYDDSHKQYYIYTDIQRRGCFQSDGFFASKIEVNDYLVDLFCGKVQFDKFVIIDCKNNKLVTPKI